MSNMVLSLSLPKYAKNTDKHINKYILLLLYYCRLDQFSSIVNFMMAICFRKVFSRNSNVI